MVPARPEKVLVEVLEQEEAGAEVEDLDLDEAWAEEPAWEPVGIVSALNAAIKAPMAGECPAIP
jgi:hypothetical protein